MVFVEKGAYNPSLQLAHDISKALKTSIDKLFLFKKQFFLVFSFCFLRENPDLQAIRWSRKSVHVTGSDIVQQRRFKLWCAD
ncbi:hypothetical protein KJ765_04455 [Candidatus Micrarchaeota archaeon]|nr:hypothetical protein [Candidatus Micrarchaeota archaeon]